MGRGRRVCAQPPPTGLTLLEVILTLSLIMLLAGVGVVSLSGMLESVSLRECSFRIASLLRTARAEAANAGRRFRLSFDDETGQPVMSTEPDPLGEPEVFQPYRPWWVKRARLDEGVSVLSCELTGASAFADLSASGPVLGEQSRQAPAQITFYPDGTSDSARIVLANDDEDHPWAVEITLNGVDGTIRTTEIDLEEGPIE